MAYDSATATPRAQRDPALVRWGLILAALTVLALLVAVPVGHVFVQALSRGAGVYWDHLVADPDTVHAILLTLTVAPVAVILNLIFGTAVAWAIARFRFPGRTTLITLTAGQGLRHRSPGRTLP